MLLVASKLADVSFLEDDDAVLDFHQEIADEERERDQTQDHLILEAL